MRILVIHNRYSSRVPSGENLAVDDEIRWLEDAGVEVHRLEASNDDVVDQGTGQKARAAASVIWSPTARRRTVGAIESTQPDIVHVHNLFPLLSSSVLGPAARRGIPIFWTVHNHRVTCIGGTNFRDGVACHDCRPGWRLPGIVHGCYTESRAASALNTGATGLFRRTARRQVTPLAISQQVKDWLVESAGFADEDVHVKFNGVAGPAPDRELIPASECTDLVFAGHLSDHKGVRLLLDAWERMGDPPNGPPEGRAPGLTVIGDGPLADDVRDLAARDNRVTWTGLLSGEDVRDHMATARAIVVPSVWDEPFGRVAAEALAHGRPVVTTGTGGLAEIVDDKVGWVTGTEPNRLAEALLTAATNDAAIRNRSAAALERHATRFSPGATTRALTTLYRAAASGRRASLPPTVQGTGP